MTTQLIGHSHLSLTCRSLEVHLLNIISFSLLPILVCLVFNISKKAEDMLGYKWPSIGNSIWRIEWSCDTQRHMKTLKFEGRDPNICGAHYLDNGCRYRLGCNGAPIGSVYLWIKWSRDRRRHSLDPERSRSWPKHAYGPISRKQLEMLSSNSRWLQVVCCEAVRLTVLATAWLLVNPGKRSLRCLASL